MTNSPSNDRDASEPFLSAAVPVLVALGAVGLALTIVRAQPFALEPAAPAAAGAASSPSADPTPYSAMHRRVEEAPDAPQPLPPTF